jgi:hypothetical protein
MSPKVTSVVTINMVALFAICLSARRGKGMTLRLKFATPSPEALHQQKIIYALAKGRFEEAVWLTINHINAGITQAIYGRIRKGDFQAFIAFMRNLVATSTRLVSDGEATTPEELRKIIFTVAKTVGFHHSALSYHRERPFYVRKDKLDINGEPEKLPVFDPTTDSSERSKHSFTSEDVAMGSELLALIVKGCRVLTKFERQVFMHCRRYCFETGKQHGMFKFCSRFVETNRQGSIIRIRSWRAKPGAPADRNVICRITKLYESACRKIERFGDDHGYPFKVD